RNKFLQIKKAFYTAMKVKGHYEELNLKIFHKEYCAKVDESSCSDLNPPGAKQVKRKVVFDCAEAKTTFRGQKVSPSKHTNNSIPTESIDGKIVTNSTLQLPNRSSSVSKTLKMIKARSVTFKGILNFKIKVK